MYAPAVVAIIVCMCKEQTAQCTGRTRSGPVLTLHNVTDLYFLLHPPEPASALVQFFARKFNMPEEQEAIIQVAGWERKIDSRKGAHHFC